MDHYAGRVLADRYRLPLPPSDECEPVPRQATFAPQTSAAAAPAESRAFDTYSGQEVLVRQVPLPEVVEAEVLDADGLPERYVAHGGGAHRSTTPTKPRTRDPVVRRAIEAAQAAAQIPDHPRLDQVFDVFAEDGSLWIVSELVAARPLAALFAERPLTPYRAAEVAADVLTALRALHAHGWVHRNITARTVLVCDDGRVMLTGLAAGAAEEALCGYDPVPVREFGGEAPPATGQGEPYTAPGRIADPYGMARSNPWHGAPATAPAAERARHARMAVVGPVTERWAPEQAGRQENGQAAAPIGPATDLWALGALLLRAVQGHAPYPEENTAELVHMVCSRPPACADECGPLRPVVESLLRQDPTQRPDFEELRGWLRRLVRSAPEPEAGAYVIAAPPMDASRLPILRRRGELVRRRRAGLPPPSRYRRGRREQPPTPRRLGRNLLLLILLGLAAVVGYAMVFMPKAEPGDSTGSGPGADPAAAGEVSPAPEAGSEPWPDRTWPADDGDDKGPSESSSSTRAQSNDPEVAQGFTLQKDSEGFQVAVANGWKRTPKNRHGQVVYAHRHFQLIVVPGRDSVGAYGTDPLAYQREDERELQPFRDSTWATSSGMRLIEVGGRTMAEGQFTWQGSQGREIFVRNLAILIGGRYHVVQVRGPEPERDEVTRLYEQASATYQVTD